MLDSEQWRSRVVADGQTLCPACQSMNLTMGACGIGSMTVHQEYVCGDCQYEFAALFGLTGCRVPNALTSWWATPWPLRTSTCTSASAPS